MPTDAELIERLARHLRFMVTGQSIDKLRPRFPAWVRELRNLGHTSIPEGLPATFEEMFTSNDILRLFNEEASRNQNLPRRLRKQKAWTAHDLRDLTRARR